MPDQWTVRAVTVILGLLSAIALGGTIYLLGADKDATAVAVVSGLAGTGFGALAGILASIRTQPPAPVVGEQP